jgi:hypothetical protein
MVIVRKLKTPTERAAEDEKRTVDVLAEENARRASDSAKSSRLRAQRLAVEEAAKPKAGSPLKPKPPAA